MAANGEELDEVLLKILERVQKCDQKTEQLF
jgi:hypothetical protein